MGRGLASAVFPGDPQHIASAVVIGNPGGDEEEVRQAVDVGQGRRIEWLSLAHQVPFIEDQ